MEHKEHHASVSHTSPKDFFLWVGVIVTFYGAVTSFLALMFQYINLAFASPVDTYGDPSYSGIRVAMASLIVLTPIALALLLIIRRTIVREPGKASIFIRRWALVLTIFLAGAVAAVDLITILVQFLGGDITTRFVLKAAIVLLVALASCLHFIADYRGYWTLHRRKADMIAAAVGALAVMTIIAGFMLVGSPSTMHAIRLDQQRVSDLSDIQYQITDYWQQKEELPTVLMDVDDPLQSYEAPVDPESAIPYEYRMLGATSFELCATFAHPTQTFSDNKGYLSAEENFQHGAGRTCFLRTIDPERYPAAPKS